jgi:hypothetical protein
VGEGAALIWLSPISGEPAPQLNPISPHYRPQMTREDSRRAGSPSAHRCSAARRVRLLRSLPQPQAECHIQTSQKKKTPAQSAIPDQRWPAYRSRLRDGTIGRCTCNHGHGFSLRLSHWPAAKTRRALMPARRRQPAVVRPAADRRPGQARPLGARVLGEARRLGARVLGEA